MSGWITKTIKDLLGEEEQTLVLPLCLAPGTLAGDGPCVGSVCKLADHVLLLLLYNDMANG